MDGSGTILAAPLPTSQEVVTVNVQGKDYTQCRYSYIASVPDSGVYQLVASDGKARVVDASEIKDGVLPDYSLPDPLLDLRV